MKILIQRVSRGSVKIEDKITGNIGKGYVILFGAKTGDSEDDARQLAYKTVNLRVFPDENGKMNRSIMDINGEILVVSQFTLYADTKKGHRPSFKNAADPEIAKELYNTYIMALRSEMGERSVKTGIFGATMRIEITNEGPVTIEISTDTSA